MMSFKQMGTVVSSLYQKDYTLKILMVMLFCQKHLLYFKETKIDYCFHLKLYNEIKNMYKNFSMH